MDGCIMPLFYIFWCSGMQDVLHPPPVAPLSWLPGGTPILLTWTLSSVSDLLASSHGYLEAHPFHSHGLYPLPVAPSHWLPAGTPMPVAPSHWLPAGTPIPLTWAPRSDSFPPLMVAEESTLEILSVISSSSKESM